MGIAYEMRTYECDEFTDGIQIAELLGLPHERVYKTLVTEGHSKEYYVFVIPVEAELDMKKAARSVGEKSVEMIHVKDIILINEMLCIFVNEPAPGANCEAVKFHVRPDASLNTR